MRYLIALLVLSTAFLWTLLITADERQWVRDNVCPVESPVVRYPAYLGGPRPAVCNPTGRVWR